MRIMPRAKSLRLRSIATLSASRCERPGLGLGEGDDLVPHHAKLLAHRRPLRERREHAA
jgi:hypothetical protein